MATQMAGIRAQDKEKWRSPSGSFSISPYGSVDEVLLRREVRVGVVDAA